MPDDIKPARSLPYGTLKQTHPDYDGRLLDELEDLYVGGFRIIKHARRYLVRLVNEHTKRYEERCTTASYQPYFAQIVDQFVSDLFGQPLSVKPAADSDNPNTPGELPDEDYYTAFEKDADREGKLFVDLMIDAIRTALKKRCALIAIDAPRPDDGFVAVSKADEKATGADRLYAYEVPIEALIDWKCKRGGNEFEWAVLNTIEQDRATPRDTRAIVKETFTVWTLPDETSKAHWERYCIEYKDDKRPEENDPVRLEDEGDASFGRIPLLRLDLPEGLWVGNKIGPQAREHWQRRSALVSAMARSMVTIPFVKKGPEAPAIGGAIPAQITQDPYRGNKPVDRFQDDGWLEIGNEDEVGFAEPDGHCYELVGKQLDELRDAMFSVNHQMAASIRPGATALGRSGLSKQKDEDATARVLRALGHEVRQFAVRIYDFISEARGDNTHWTPHGLDAYSHEDREQVLEEGISVDQIAIPSVTFRKVYKKTVANKLLRGEVDPETLSTIFQEIEDGVDDEEELRGIKRDAEIDAIQNPQVPQVTVPKGPMVKTPQAKPPQKPQVGGKQPNA